MATSEPFSSDVRDDGHQDRALLEFAEAANKYRCVGTLGDGVLYMVIQLPIGSSAGV